MGIGGSATNDGGVGMLQALGCGFYDRNGLSIPFGASGLADLRHISEQDVLPELSECEFLIACDVKNPLCGELGASAVFGHQKEARQEMVMQMDKWLQNYASIAKNLYPNADSNAAGCGAAGGMGFAFLTFANVCLESGIDIVIEETALEDKLKAADFVITGEGRLDGQTVMGKVPSGVANLAKKYSIAVIAFAGSVGEDTTKCNEKSIEAFSPH